MKPPLPADSRAAESPLWIRPLAALVALAMLTALYLVLYRVFALYDPRVALALQGSALAALATGVGTLPLLFVRRFSQRANDTMLGFGAGVMLAATAFSLLTPGLDAAQEMAQGAWAPALIVSVGVLLGAGVLMAGEWVVPHEHFVKGREGRESARAIRRAWLFVFAIALHNIPEGLAMGVAFSSPDPATAYALVAGITAQNGVEGLVTAMAIRGAGYSRSFAMALGAASGLVEPVAAILGALLVSLSSVLLPWGLAFAAGAMLFVISHEVIPESHRKGHEAFATGGLLIGFVLMMSLDTVLG